MDCCGGARTKNSGLLVPSQHLFSLGGLLGESSENVRQRKGNMGMEKGGSKGNKIIVTIANSMPGTVLYICPVKFSQHDHSF